MKSIIIVSAFSNLNKSSSRVSSVFNKVIGEKLVVTTDFNHMRKCYYNDINKNQNQVCIHVPKYKKNLSVSRIISHVFFAIKLKKFLTKLKTKPDAIYCAMPTSSSAYVCAQFCKKNNIKFVIDVIDLWPDSLLPITKGMSFLKLFLYPWMAITRMAYKNADSIIAESQKYASEAKRYNTKASVYPIYLGVNTNLTAALKEAPLMKLNKESDEIWIAYAGNLGTSYDFNELLSAVRKIHGKFKYKLWFIGDGQEHQHINNYIQTYHLNAAITGYVQYNELLSFLSYCDIAINIFKKNTKVVYSYKFNDYVAMNCFVLNSLVGETAQMVDDYKIGRNFDFEDNNLPSILYDTLVNWDFYSQWKSNTNTLVSDKLDSSKIYNVITEIFS